MILFLKRTAICILFCITIFVLWGFMFVETGVAAPYPSYTYNFWQEEVPAPQAYLPEKVLGNEELDIRLRNPRDMSIREGLVYLADSGNDRIIIIDSSQWTVIGTIDEFGNGDTFRNPVGIFVTERKDIYVADRDNERIVVLGHDGKLRRIIESPRPDVEGVIPDDFVFLPTKLGVDQAGRVYVIAEGVYDGLLEFDNEGVFRGFIGAPRITPSVFDYFWRTYIATAEQRERMRLFLPVEHSNIDIDRRGFIYVTVTGGALRDEEAIRRLNPSGQDVLRRMGFHAPVGDYGISLRDEEGNLVLPPSRLIDITARENDIYSVLDRERGRIFSYDNNGNLLYIFGGEGDGRGLFRRPAAIDTIDDRIIVLDSRAENITVFKPTLYGANIHAAIDYYVSGDYDRSTEQWQNVLRLNSNYDLAYTGIGRALLRQDDFEDAMFYFRLGQNRDGFSEAFSLFRRQTIAERFGSIISGLIALVVVLLLMRKTGATARIINLIKRDRLARAESATQTVAVYEERSWLNKVFSTLIILGSSLRFSLNVVFHPFSGFWDLKHEKKGNMLSASVLLLLVVLSYIFVRQYTGFIFNPRDPRSINILVEAISVILPFGLWCVVNWALTTLMEGKGTLREVYIASAFALAPIILINFPLTVISNYLTQDEGSFYFFLLATAIIWALTLMFFGTMVTHDYDMPKTIMTTILILIGIASMLFIGLLFFSLGEQLMRFLFSLYVELTLG